MGEGVQEIKNMFVMETETQKKVLEVGDVLWSFLNGNPYLRQEVERITTTQAILKNGVKVKRELQSPYIDNSNSLYATAIGDSGLLGKQWYLETPEIIKAFNGWQKRKELKEVLEQIHWKHLPEDKVEPLLSAIKEILGTE